MDTPIALKKCLPCKKLCHSMGAIINHVKNPNHDKLFISSYSEYVDNPEKVLDFIEYNKK